eukprot:gnl/Chilomastix_cuspidata/1029.p2 GENE.gnl/Chilomastix_cuspidata/1029~~gnl/Chilomastix_cuspidata/1029.p2  ORF type:complete len:258 (-),score=146.73 gnl/Chilomastix_cuspidata/1029:9-782(-)
MATFADEMVWKCINEGFCSFKMKTKSGKALCRNKYNLTGMCTKKNCPLANSQYATVLDVEGKVFLVMKTVERSHTPAKQWERVRLPENYSEALKVIDEQLKHWPRYMTHRCKQRLTRIAQTHMRIRRLRKRMKATAIVRAMPKVKRREQSRQMRALAAANLERVIQKELLRRLHTDVYKGIYNFSERAYQGVLRELGAEAADMEAVEQERLREFITSDEAARLADIEDAAAPAEREASDEASDEREAAREREVAAHE